VRFSFSVTGRKVVRETTADSAEEDEAKAMEELDGEGSSDYHVKIDGTWYLSVSTVACYI
jgi:hypothetical protein